MMMEQPRQFYLQLRQCITDWSICVIVIGFSLSVTTLLALTMHLLTQTTFVLMVDASKQGDDKFLSVALDSSIIAENFRNFDMQNPDLLLLMKNLAPAYLRIGGTMADRLKFVSDNSIPIKTEVIKDIDGGECSYENIKCDTLYNRPNFTMSGKEWLELYAMSKTVGFTLIFDLNVLLRKVDNSWDTKNAEELIKFSDEHEMDLHWELGNEPNSFRHVFNYVVNATQLAEDFKTLKNILYRYPRYANSLLVGPDVTRPRGNKSNSMKFLKEFIANGGGDVLDAITWHQYYINGRTATANNFVDVEIFNLLQKQISAVQNVLKNNGAQHKPLWLGETGSAYGGGSSSFSNRYIGTFIWLDKLGLAAKNGLKVVIRQSLFKGYYALIDDDYTPNPDFWISVIFKSFVAPQVVECNVAASQWVRLYCHCAAQRVSHPGGNSLSRITIYGINMLNISAQVRFLDDFIGTDDGDDQLIEGYILTAGSSIYSREIMLNDVLLKMEPDSLPKFLPRQLDGRDPLVMPPQSLVFWVVHGTNVKSCASRSSVDVVG